MGVDQRRNIKLNNETLYYDGNDGLKLSWLEFPRTKVIEIELEGKASFRCLISLLIPKDDGPIQSHWSVTH